MNRSSLASASTLYPPYTIPTRIPFTRPAKNMTEANERQKNSQIYTREQDGTLNSDGSSKYSDTNSSLSGVSSYYNHHTISIATTPSLSPAPSSLSPSSDSASSSESGSASATPPQPHSKSIIPPDFSLGTPDNSPVKTKLSQNSQRKSSTPSRTLFPIQTAPTIELNSNTPYNDTGVGIGLIEQMRIQSNRNHSAPSSIN